MTNTLDWNTAIEEQEDWKAAMNSEVFRNYINTINKVAATKEQLDLDDELRSPPIMQNLPYDGESFQEHAKKKIAKVNPGVIALIKAASDEIDKINNDSDNSEDFEDAKNSEDFEEIDDSENSDDTIDGEDIFELKNTENTEYKELYNTDAGETDFIDVGITAATEDLIEEGIDYTDNENLDEIKKAEAALGLNRNISYILFKMGK